MPWVSHFIGSCGRTCCIQRQLVVDEEHAGDELQDDGDRGDDGEALRPDRGTLEKAMPAGERPTPAPSARRIRAS
jgi:hypothetical protein